MMTCPRVVLALLLTVASFGASSPSLAPQEPGDTPEVQSQPSPDTDPDTTSTPEPEEAAQTEEESAATDATAGPRPRPVVRIGQGHTVRAEDVVREVVVIMGSAVIEGTVERDVVVILGTVQVGPEADIGGSVVNVGGHTEIVDGAAVARDLVVVGGGLTAPDGFAPGGDHVVVAPPGLENRMATIVPWFTRGLLWGRPVVPELPWVWLLVGVALLAYLMLSLLFDRPMRKCVEILEEKPLSASLTGLLVLILVGPLSFLLTVSVVGIVVIPFALAALFIAALFGRATVARWVGARLLPERDPEDRLLGIRSVLIGFAIIVVSYMIPVLGLMAWALVGIFGLGAVTLAFADGLRQERPALAAAGGPPSLDPAFSMGGGPAIRDSVGNTSPEADRIDPGTFTYAGFGGRVGAFALDLLLVAISAGLLGLMDRGGSLILLLLAYHIGFWTWKGTTVGGIICRLRIIRTDGQPLGFADALVRGLASIFSLIVVGLGALWILWAPERQSWHDKIAGTCVVRVPRNYPL